MQPGRFKRTRVCAINVARWADSARDHAYSSGFGIVKTFVAIQTQYEIRPYFEFQIQLRNQKKKFQVRFFLFGKKLSHRVEERQKYFNSKW